jgi:hypothetical protein
MVIIGSNECGMLVLMMKFMKMAIEKGIGVLRPMSDVMKEIKGDLKGEGERNKEE